MFLFRLSNYLPKFQYQSKYGKHDSDYSSKLNYIRRIAKPQSHSHNVKSQSSIFKRNKFNPYF